MAARNANIKIDLVFDGSGMTKGINQIKNHLKGLQKSAESANKSIGSMGSGSKGFNSLLASANKFNSTMNSNITQQSSNMNSQYNSAASNMESSFQRAGIRVSSIIAGIATALAALTFGNLLKEGVGDAMMVEASLAAVDKRFGDSASEITKWAQANSQAFGMSEGEAINYLNSVSIMLSKSVQDTEQLAQLSKEYVNMIAVVSTATGYSAEAVYEKVMSGLRGATTAIDDLSINIKVKSLEASEAFKYLAPPSATWDQLSVELQDQIRILAIVTEAYEVHGNTIGTNVAGQHGALVGALKTTRTALGQAFLPIYVTIIPILNSMVLWLQKAVVWVGRFIYAIFGQTAAMKALRAQQEKEKKDFMVRSAENVKDMSNQTNTASESIDRLGKKNVDAAKKAKKAGEEYKKASKNVQGFDKINKMASEDKPKASGLETPEIAKTKEDKAGSLSPTSLPGNALNDLGLTGNQDLTLGDDFESLLDQMEDVPEEMQVMADKLREKWDKLVVIYEDAKKFLFGEKDKDGNVTSEGLIKRLEKFLFGEKDKDGNVTSEGFIAKKMPWLIGLFATIGAYLAISKFTAIASIVQTGLTAIGAAFAAISWPVVAIAIIIGILVAAIVDLWKNNEEFRKNIIEAWNNIKDILTLIWENFIKPVLESVVNMFKRIWEEGLKPLWDKLKIFIANFAEMFNVVLETLKPVITFLIEMFGPMFAKAFDGIANAVATAVNIILGVIGTIIDVLGNMMKFVTNIFQRDWSAAWGVVKDTFGSMFSGIINIASGVVNVVIDLVNGMIQGVMHGANYITGLLSSLSFDIPDWVPVLGGESFNFSIDPINIPKIPHIPKLAQGGVIPPRNERLFIAGDNKVEDEIIAPESKLRAMAQEVAMSVAGSGGNSETNQLLKELIQISKQSQVIQVEGRDLGRSERAESLKNFHRTGVRN